MEIKHNGYGYECVLRDGYAESAAVYENHCHPFYEIIMVREGEAMLSIENRSFTARAGALIVIRPGAYHSVTVPKGSEYRRITLLFEEFVIPEGIKKRFFAELHQDLVCYHAEAPALLSRLFYALKRQNEEGDGYRELIESLFVEMFYLLVSGESYSDEGETDRSLQLMLDYITCHITERITLEDIAAAAFVSKSAACRVFKEKIHTTFKQYLLQKKVSYAAHLIGQGMSANEAARIVGYENYAGFYKMYRKFLSKSPTDRKNASKEQTI